MANDAPCAAKTAHHLLTGYVFVSIHLDEIGDVLLAPLAFWASQAQTPRLLLDRPAAPPEVPLHVGKRDVGVGIHTHEVFDFLFRPAISDHGLLFIYVR